MSLAPGTRLGRCEVLASLGARGMGEVYRARDEGPNDPPRAHVPVAGHARGRGHGRAHGPTYPGTDRERGRCWPRSS